MGEFGVENRVTHADLDSLHFIQGSAFARQKIKWYADEYAAGFGGCLIIWDDAALVEVMGHWRESYVVWRQKALGEAMAQGVLESDFGELSFIKTLAILLWAMTQNGLEPIKLVEIKGLLPPDTRDLVTAYPNEFFSFMGIFWMFHDLQHQRKIDSRYDLRNPPMHYRYYRAMVHYLAKQYPRQDDLYLILKTFDLAAMKTDYRQNPTID